MANFKAQFKTAVGQKELVLDCKVSTGLVVGQVCTYDSATQTLSPKASEAAAGDFIVAQSDISMMSHIPVENRDYRYNPNVAASTDLKKVAVFKVTEAEDVYSVQIGGSTPAPEPEPEPEPDEPTPEE